MSTLPNEIWVMIFSFLCWNTDIKAVLLTCRLFNDLITNAVWSSVWLKIQPALDESPFYRVNRLLLTEDIIPAHQRKLVQYLRLSKFNGEFHEFCWDLKDLLEQFTGLKHLRLELPIFEIRLNDSLKLTSLSLDFVRPVARIIPRAGLPCFLEGGNAYELVQWLRMVRWDQKGLLTLLTLPTLRKLALRNGGRFMTMIILVLRLARRSLPITHLSLYSCDIEAQKGVIHLIESIKQLSSIKISLSNKETKDIRQNVVASILDLPAALRLHQKSLEEFIITHSPRLQGRFPAAAPLLKWRHLDLSNVRVLYVPTEQFACKSRPFLIGHGVERLGLTTSIYSERYEKQPIETMDFTRDRLESIANLKNSLTPNLKVIEWWIIPPPIPLRSHQPTLLSEEVTRSAAPKARDISDALRTHAWFASFQMQLQKLEVIMATVGLDFKWTWTRDVRRTSLAGGYERKDWRSFDVDFESDMTEEECCSLF